MPRRLRVARLLITALLVTTTGLSFLLDWSANHLLNPLWHPHARFHGALLLFFLAGVTGTAVWHLWRQSSETAARVQAGALLSLSFWTPLFYVTSVLPGSTSWAGAPGDDPRLHGSLITPNLVVAGAFVALSVAAFRMARQTRTDPTT